MALVLADQTTNGNTLTNLNTVTEYVSDFPYVAITSTAAFASASNQWLRADDSTSLSITGNITLMAWIKKDTINAVHTIMGKWEATIGSNRSYMFRLLADNTLQFRTSSDGAGSAAAVTSDTVTSTVAWTHVAVTYNAAAGTCAFYIDGSASQTGASLATALFDGTARFGIGGEDATTDTPGSPFNGKIADVRVYSRELTSGQISTVYNALQTNPLEGNLNAFWPFQTIPAVTGGVSRGYSSII